MSRGPRRAALVLTSAALAVGSLGLAACGDDEDSGDVTIPEISTPTETGTGTTTTTPESGGVPPEGDTGKTSPGSGGTGTNTQEDSATNDTPPAPGSPEEAFEKQCEKNPAACG